MKLNFIYITVFFTLSLTATVYASDSHFINVNRIYVGFCSIDSFPDIKYSKSGISNNEILIGGRIRMPNGKAVTNTFPVINSAMAGHPDTVPTTNTGQYEFQVLRGLDYTVSVFRNVQDYLNGVTTLDMVLIGRHIIGVQPFQSRWQLVASDVNNDKRISVLDMIEIRKLILGASDQWAAPSWWFFDASVEEEDPFMVQIPITLFFEDLNDSVENADFIGVKTGDVNYNAMPFDNEKETPIRSQDHLQLLAADRYVKPGESFELPITSDNFQEVFGYQFSLEMNGLKLITVKPGSLQIDDSNYATPKNNMMTMSWNEAYAQTSSVEDVLFTLEMISEKEGQVSNMLSLSSAVTKAEAYTGAQMKIVDVDLTFKSLQEVSLQMFQNVPNPFRESTLLEYKVPEQGEVTLSVFDSSGRLLIQKRSLAAKGINSFILTGSEIGIKGVLICQLEYGNTKMSRKIIAID